MPTVAKFYETYHMCAIVDGVLKNTLDNALMLEGFHCDEQWTGWLSPFPKFSVLHKFIEYVVRDTHAEQANDLDLDGRKKIFESFKHFQEAIDDLRPHKLPIEDAFDHHGIEHLSFSEHLRERRKKFSEADADDVYDFMNEVWISAAYERLMKQTVEEVFHVLFANRELMMQFNDYVSGILSRVDWQSAEEIDRSLLASRGTLARAKPPKWATRAVFFRDRGRCVMCDRDLTGLVSLENVENYDHIVPLARWGLNDVSNLQLLCAPCNQYRKGSGDAVTSGRYQAWYSTGDD